MGIRIFELDDSLKKIVTDKNKISLSTSSTIITTTTSNIPINISNFNKDNDNLMVYENSVYLNQDTDYIINSDNTISLPNSGTWNGSEKNPIVFDFVAILNTVNSEMEISPDGALLKDHSITKSKLSQDILDALSSIERGVKSISIEQNAWVANNTSKLFDATINHGLNKTNLSVSAFTTDGDQILVALKVIDANTIKLTSTVAYNCTVKISY